MKIKNYWFTLLMLISILLTGCHDQTADNPPLRLATAAQYPPFEFVSKGELTGFDIDLAQLISQKIGRKIVFEDMQFSAILYALQSGHVDGAISMVTITPERQQNFDFSIPYLIETQSILSTKAHPITEQDLNSSDIIGVQLGSTMEIWMKKHYPNVPTHTFDNTNLALEALLAGHINAVLLTSVQAALYNKQHPQLSQSVVKNNIINYGIGMIFPKESPVLGPINLAIKELQQEGQIDALYKKWLVDTVAEGRLSNNTFFDNVLTVGKGIVMTLQLLAGALLLGSSISLLWIALILNGKNRSSLSLKGAAAWLARRVISILRGTPVLLQLMIIYFSLPPLLDIKLSVLQAGIITFGLNSSAYIAEILRAGINSIPQGQFEAAKTLQIPFLATWRDIILPQVIRNILPAMINEMIALVKETALIATIGGLDIMRHSQLLAAENFDYFQPLFIAGVYYYALVLFMEYLGKKLEGRNHYA